MNDLLIYIIVGILWLIFSILGKKQKQQQRTKSENWSLEDALRELEMPSQGEEPMATPAPAESVSSPWPDEFQGFPAKFADDNFQQPVKRRPAPQKPASKPTTRSSSLPKSAIIARLRDAQSAQTAVVLSEVLGKPRAHRPPVGFPRMYNP